MIIFQMFYEFLKIGLFSVGGGMATLPFLYDLSARTLWFSEAQIADMLAISESTPGPLGINMATYVGYTVAGVPGAIAATVGTIIPGIVVVLLIVTALEKFRNSREVKGAFYGLRPASTALIAAAGLQVLKITMLDEPSYAASGSLLSLLNVKAVFFAAVLLVLTRYCKPTRKLHPIIFIAVSAVVGVVFAF